MLKFVNEIIGGIFSLIIFYIIFEVVTTFSIPPTSPFYSTYESLRGLVNFMFSTPEGIISLSIFLIAAIIFLVSKLGSKNEYHGFV